MSSWVDNSSCDDWESILAPEDWDASIAEVTVLRDSSEGILLEKVSAKDAAIKIFF